MLAGLRAHLPMPVALQIAYPGRKASLGAPWEGGAQLRPGKPMAWKTLASSAVPHGAADDLPLLLDAAGMDRVRHDCNVIARRGVDALDIHMAHGYLLHQFLSVLAKRRQNCYGGSLEHRMRFAFEVFDAVRATFPAERPVVGAHLRRLLGARRLVDGTVALSKARQARACAAIFT